jgi:hypothetical protein
MDDLDRVVIRAWELSSEDYTDEVYAAFEEMLPMLEAAGYVDADEHLWRWTAEGVARAEALTGEAPN